MNTCVCKTFKSNPRTSGQLVKLVHMHSMLFGAQVLNLNWGFAKLCHRIQ